MHQNSRWTGGVSDDLVDQMDFIVFLFYSLFPTQVSQAWLLALFQVAIPNHYHFQIVKCENKNAKPSNGEPNMNIATAYLAT